MTLHEWLIEAPAAITELKHEFGEEPDIYTYQPEYLYHLEQMLKSPNPEQYYREHKPKESK